MQEDNIETKYTVIPLKEKENQVILEKWVNNTNLSYKASMCRFFLRGMCIMKKQYCKFAHGMDDIIEQVEQPIPKGLNEKEIKKRVVANKSHFNQKALFLCQLVYYNLYQYSLESNPKNPLPLQTLNTDFDVRNKLRLKFHRHHWQKFMDFVQKKHPNANITIPFLSDLYTKYGFVKPHTHCKLHMLLYWIEQNKFYVRHEVVLPPLVQTKTSIIFKRYSKRPMDKVFLKDYEMSEALKEKKEVGTNEVNKEKLNEGLIKEYINSKVVNEKTTICKFYMKGLCMFSEDQCKFCHSFATLNYTYRDSIVADLNYFEQKALFSEPKLNYFSLHSYQEIALQKNLYLNILSQQELNKSSNARQELKDVLMNDLYSQFLAKLEELYPDARWTIPFVKRQFINCGLNKAKVDRFPVFLDKLEDIGYEMDSFLIPPNTKKREYIFKREPLQVLDSQISSLLRHIIQKRLESEQQETVIITEPYIRKKYYQFQHQFTIPVHRYLKIRGITLKDYIQEQIDSPTKDSLHLNRVSFDLQDNISKIKQKLKQYYNTSKQRQHQYTSVQSYIVKHCEDNIKNYIALSGLKWCIIGESIELHKQVYVFPDGQVIICHKKHHREDVNQCQCNVKGIQQRLELGEEIDVEGIRKKYQKQRVVVIDDSQTILYSKIVLGLVEVIGVDLEGSLKEDGFVYLVQVGIKNPSTLQNQTLVFDIFSLKNKEQLLNNALQSIKYVMENEKVIKVMHDCKNDSVALHTLLKCCVYPVFDTCWMQSYFDQKELNESFKDKEDFVRNIFKVSAKTLGLNQVLQKYGRPTNLLKESMKKIFESSPESKSLKFQARPIDKDFLQYAVRDVQELIDVYSAASKQDQHNIWRQIGLCASTVLLK